LWHIRQIFCHEAFVTPATDVDRSWMLFPHGLLVFERADPAGPSHLLVSHVDFCTTPACSCRDVGLRAIAVDADDDFDPAVLSADTLRAEFATNAMEARLDIDTGRVVPDDYEGRVPLSPDWIDYLQSTIDGELLDELHDRWLRAKGTKSVPKTDWQPRGPGDLVGWHEVHPADRPDVYLDDDGAFLAEELFCVNPTCTCSEAVIAFAPAAVGHAPDVGAIRLRVPSLHVIQRDVTPEHAALLDRLWRAFSRRHRNLPARLTQRTTHMLTLASKRRPHRTPTTRSSARVGRNQPCPCGSGKKFKRCCG
jgi:hypothetical protein